MSGWKLVPVEATDEMTMRAEVALSEWRAGLSPDDKLLRHVIKRGRGFTEATVPEKHALRWIAMSGTAPSPPDEVLERMADAFLDEYAITGNDVEAMRAALAAAEGEQASIPTKMEGR